MKITIKKGVGEYETTSTFEIPNWLMLVGLFVIDNILYRRTQIKVAKVYAER